jgi:hypothetical protein
MQAGRSSVKIPETGIADGRPRATSGRIAVAPPSVDMNYRRLMPSTIAPFSVPLMHPQRRISEHHQKAEIEPRRRMVVYNSRIVDVMLPVLLFRAQINGA